MRVNECNSNVKMLVGGKTMVITSVTDLTEEIKSRIISNYFHKKIEGGA